MTSPTREYMIEKLLQWNPRWRSETVRGWHYRQLLAVYIKERARVLGHIQSRVSRPRETGGFEQLAFPW